MKIMMTFVFLLFSLSSAALAQSPSPSQVQTLAPLVQSSTTISTDSFLGDTMQIMSQWSGALPIGLKIASIVLLIIASMKVSFLNQMIWSKLGKFQAVAAPILGLILGLTLLGTGGPVTLSMVFAYLASGAGAIALHELLDMVKAIPGIGSAYVGIINVIESALGGGSSSA